MKTFKLEIQLDNDAFIGNALPEIARILGNLSEELTSDHESNHYYFKNLLDINGNVVGTYAIKDIVDGENRFPQEWENR